MIKKFKKVNLEGIRNQIVMNWKKDHDFLGIKRMSLEKLSDDKKWRVRKVIAIMRRKKEIFFHRKRYFINLSKIWEKRDEEQRSNS
jgi:hypothetical protein